MNNGDMDDITELRKEHDIMKSVITTYEEHLDFIKHGRIYKQVMP